MDNLKEIGTNRSLLYIEQDKELQQKVFNYLDKIFDKVYQSYDGLNALAKCKVNKPNIILMDLSFKKIDAIKLIVDLQELNKDIRIIILSEENENFNFIKSFDMGFAEILKKPIDFNRLNYAIKNELKKLPKIVKPIKKPILKQVDKIKQNHNIDTGCFNDIENLFKSKEPVTCFNSYKGIKIHNIGSIEQVQKNIFQIKTSKIQMVSAKYEKLMILKLDKLNKYIMASILKVDMESSILTLVNPKYFNYKARDIQSNRVVVDKSFKASAYMDNKHVDLDTSYISYLSAALHTTSINIDKKVSDEFDLTLGFDLSSSVSLVKEKKFTKVFAKAKILRIDKIKDRINIIVSLDIQKSGQNTFKKYIQQREMDIIKELKTRLRT